ncbi:MAG: lamin tail domain-containing protein [Bacteroidales bacterium]|nr:lamin tail domain-containing protein [Bacteroidales bacterium]
MKKLTLFAIASGLWTLSAVPLIAQSWIDVTDVFIKNAHFLNNSTEGWEGDEFGFAGPMYNAEHYNKTFNTYQDLAGLTPGTYRLSLKGYYRAGEAGNDYEYFRFYGDDYRHAQLYATSSVNDYSTQLVYCSSAAQPSPLGGATSSVYDDNGKEWFIPNNMEAAHYWFEAGYYLNELYDIVVGNDGKLRIGIRKDRQLGGDWTCITDWKLELWGTLVKITWISLKTSKSEIAIGETLQVNPTISPSNATFKNLAWSSSNENVAMVDQNGLVTGLSAGKVTITGTATDGSNRKGSIDITVKADGGNESSLIINEIMPANLDLFVDPSWNYGGYIEIYNPTSSTAAIGGYYLSDDESNLRKWHIPATIGTVPAKGYKAIWFDHNDQYCKTQANFKLDIEGGTIYIADSNGKLITSQDYPACFRRCSYARTTDGANSWGWTGTPTPESTNNQCAYASQQLPLPEVDKQGQIFSGTLQIVASIPSGATLRYTTDGSVPTTTNGYTSQTGVFTISKSTAYRFRLYKQGYLPSDVKTCSYIHNDYDFCVPVISIVTDDKNINGRDYGIFVAGSGNGRSGRGQSGKCNWNMEWDRPVSMEYIPEGEDEVVVAQEVNMSAVGGWSRAWTPHSFKLKANKQYGLNYLPYAFFENKPYNKNKTLQIRNGGNDNGCRIIDAAIQTIVARSGIDVDCQSYKPVFVFINGKMYNVLNMREPNNKHFAYANKGIDDEEMDQFEYSPDSAYVQMEGTRDAFERWYDLSYDASDDDVYEEIKQIVDIDEFINYFAVEMYIGCGDWINNSNNLKGYRYAGEGGKFRFTMFDTDSYGGTGQFSSVENSNWQTLDYIYELGTSLSSEIEIITIWLNMLENAQFRKQFTDAFCLVAGSVFEPTRCKEIVNELANKAASAMSQVGGSPWNSANGVISTFSSGRQKTMINQMKNYWRLQLSNAKTITAKFSTNFNEGKLLVNDQPVPTNKFSGTLFLPVTVRAEAPAGYKFKGWQGGGGATFSTVFKYGDTWDFYDKGSLDGKSWQSSSFFATGWKSGATPIGYISGTTWPGTTIKTQAAEKLPTYYFRKTFTLSDKPASNDQFEINFNVDDGCIVYVNGTEAGRFNMPGGYVSYNSYASTYCDDFEMPQTLSLSPSLFKKGSNIIAVEVHNNNNTSSDALWDAELLTTVGSKPSEDNFISTDAEFVLNSNIEAVAIFEPLSPEEMLAQGRAPVRINEVSAGNSIYINDYFKKEDWMELYNTTDEPVDIAGMFLSDNINKPQKFQIAQGDVSTLIEPHGFRILWCDKNDNISQLHTSFKLGNEDGSYVLLTAEDGSWADTLQYDAHTGDMTYGRYPDGSNTIYTMFRPTIAQSNVITTYDAIHIEMRPPVVDGIESETFIARDGNMSISYSGGYILVKNEECKSADLFIYSLSGQLIDKTALSLGSGHAAYQVQLPLGTYVARVRDNSGNSCATKFVIR